MALSARPLVVQLAREVLARWASRATGLTPYLGDSGEPRPALPYVSLTIARGRTGTGYRHLREFTETIGPQAIVVSAGLGEAVTLLANGARVSRVVAEPLVEFAPLLAADLLWWLRGRCDAQAAGDDVLVSPQAPGLLLQLVPIEGCALADADPGPPGRVIERLYPLTCRVEVLGAPTGVAVGAAGDGLDTYSIEAALREELSRPRTKYELQGAQLRARGLQEGTPSYASSVSGLRRESRVIFDLEFGLAGWFAEDAEPIVSAEMDAQGESGGGVIVLPPDLP